MLSAMIDLKAVRVGVTDAIITAWLKYIGLRENATGGDGYP